MSQSRLHDIKKPAKHYDAKYKNTATIQEKPRLPRASSVRPPVQYRRLTNQHHNGGGKGVWYIAFILIIGLFFGLSIFFTKAKVTITPTIKEVPLNERLIAYKKSISQELTFDTMIVSGSVEENVSSETKENVEEFARGTVRIYNNSGSEPQTLRIDTRLVDEQGLIYKTEKAVTVPGQTTTDGKKVPGYIDVSIYADKPGESYNTDSEKTLKLIGFKEANSPKYETIYAKTMGPLEGGFQGERFVVSDDQKQEIIDRLSLKLSDDLLQKSQAQVPDQTIFPEALSVLTDKKVTEKVSDDGTITVSVSGSMFNVIFNSVELERFILGNSIVGVDQESAYISNIDSLNISYVDQASQTVNPEALENLAFTIDDTLKIISIVNTESLVFDLVGQKKRDFQTIISAYPGVQYVEYDIDPFWRNRFPDASEDIKISLTTEEEIDQ